MTTEERLTRLERKNWRLTLALILTGLAAILAVGVGMAASEVIPEEVMAHRFTLVDENDNVRIILKVIRGYPFGGVKETNGCGVFVFDENGKSKVSLGVDEASSGLAVFDENGKARIGLSVYKDGPGFSIWDANGNGRTWRSLPQGL